MHSYFELEELTDDFMKASADTVYESQVWPASKETICTEVTLTCNHLIASCASYQWKKVTERPRHESTKTNDLLLHTLNRVSQCFHSPHSFTRSVIPKNSANSTVANQMMCLISSLENPVIHFKALDVMGHVLALVCIWCVYSQQMDRKVQEAFSCLTEMIKLATGSVLKERLPQCQGFLLCSPVDDSQEQDTVVPCVEDLISLVCIAFEHHCNFVMDFESWKWLHLCLECKQIIKEEKYTNVMSKLSEALKTDLDPENKARILCLFAECYQKQGCHQLAVQTYREALEADNECNYVLWYLSIIYQTLGKNDLEIESLNLLVSMMSNKQASSKSQRLDFGMDEIIWSIFTPIVPMTLPLAMYVFAKRCFQLKRYKESAEHYFHLVQNLQSGNLFPQFTNESPIDVDVREILVEAAEAFLKCQRWNDCLSISSLVCSCLSMTDSFISPQDHSKAWDPFEDDEEDSLSLFPSQDISHHASFNSIGQSGTHNTTVQGVSSENDVTSSIDWNILSTGIRKRLRSDELKQKEENRTEDKTYLLKARALLCQSDALILSEGFTDQSMEYLSQALDILLNHPSGSRQSSTLDESLQTPGLKRQRISSDNADRGVKPKHKGNDQCPNKSTGPSGWMALILNTALRMGRASLERKEFAAVMNSCLLALQLDPDNIEGFYMKTIVLLDNIHDNARKTAIEWLQKRGLQITGDRAKFQLMIQRKTKDLEKEQAEVEENWWQVRAQKKIALDIKCLQCLHDVSR